jgi:hypothetical protein
VNYQYPKIKYTYPPPRQRSIALTTAIPRTQSEKSSFGPTFGRFEPLWLRSIGLLYVFFDYNWACHAVASAKADVNLPRPPPLANLASRAMFQAANIHKMLHEFLLTTHGKDTIGCG